MTIDLRTGQEYAPRREDYCTKIAAVAPADIATPLWRDFLDRITAGDADLQSYLRRRPAAPTFGARCSGEN